MAPDFELSQLISALITILIMSLFLNWAAGIVLGRRSFGAALLVAIVGTLAATLVFALLGAGVLGIVVAIIVWAAVAAVMFRTQLLRGAVIGLVAWVLWAVVTWLVGLIINAL